MRLASVAPTFETLQYPLTTQHLLDAVGDVVIELPGGDETVRDAIARTNDDTYTCPEDAVLTLYSALSVDAIGRRAYSDRDPPIQGADEPEPVSF